MKPPRRPFILGLTGSIGMGKSAVAAMVRRLGIPVFDADAEVHALLARNGAAVAKIARLFPDTLKNQAIDRKKLGALVFNNPAQLRRLEKILHPLVRRQERAFLAAAKKQKSPLVVLEIPLLFETGGDRRCDATLCVTAPAKIQQARLLVRPGMTPEKIRAIRKHQWLDKEKRSRATYILNTGKPLSATRQDLVRLLQKLQVL